MGSCAYFRFNTKPPAHTSMCVLVCARFFSSLQTIQARLSNHRTPYKPRTYYNRAVRTARFVVSARFQAMRRPGRRAFRLDVRFRAARRPDGALRHISKQRRPDGALRHVSRLRAVRTARFRRSSTYYVLLITSYLSSTTNYYHH